MKRSTIVTLLVFILLMPLTLYFGTKLTGRSYYITGTLMILEMLVPMFMSFEGGKPGARKLVVIAVLCAITVISRVAIPIPHFKPMFAIIMLSGIAFGPQTGFVVGAISAYVSNFFVGQGAYTPWQMFAYGAGGLLAGVLFWKHRQKPWVYAAFGFFATLLWVGPLLDTSSVFLTLTVFNWKNVLLLYLSGLPINLIQSVSTALTMLILAKPFLDKLDRMNLKYGMQEQ